MRSLSWCRAWGWNAAPAGTHDRVELVCDPLLIREEQLNELRGVGAVRDRARGLGATGEVRDCDVGVCDHRMPDAAGVTMRWPAVGRLRWC